MKRKLLFHLLFLCICIFSWQCVDQISLKIDGSPRNVVVDGLLTDSLMDHVIKIRYSAALGVGNDNILEPLPGASVTVIDNENARFKFLETRPGFYNLKMKGIAGKSYYLEIVLADGKKIKSDPQLLTPAPPIGKIVTEVKDETFINASGNVSVDTRLILKMNVDLNGATGSPYLRWRAEGEYEFREAYPMALSTKVCYVKNNVDLSNLRIFDSKNISGRFIKDEPFINTPLDYRFANQYCFHVLQYSISEKEYIYWKRVRSITTLDGSLFDNPPGKVIGNLYYTDSKTENVVGYFSVNGLQSMRFFANPQSLNQIDIEPKCRFRFNSTPSRDCLDCLTIDESTLVKPSYWQ